MRLTDYVCRYLVAKKIKHIFMVSGGGAMYLVDSIGRHPKLEYICPHHEQAAAIAAEGYARTSGKMGVVVITSGPGGTNTLTGVIGQWLDSIPVLYLSGQVKFATTIASCPHLGLRQLGDQEINIVDIVKPVTKYATMIVNPEEIRYHLEKAVYLATHGRPGPVWLDIPLNVQSALIDESKLVRYDSKEDEIRSDSFLPQQVSKIIARLRKAERPVILAGHGIRLAGAEKLFLKLVNRLKIPILTAICGHDLIESSHPFFLGRPGICGDRAGNFIIQNSDFLLVIGARLGIRQISYNYELFARKAYKVMVDIDKVELEKPTLNINMKVHTDARIFIQEMLGQLKGEKIKAKKWWLGWCRDRGKMLPNILAENSSNQKYVNSYLFADVLFKLLSQDWIVVTGNGTAYTGTYQIMHIKKGVRVFTNQGCAAMGYDLPAAIGASVAKNKGSVVLITGDGSIQMNIQELQTIAANRFPIKIFVLNNKGYLSIRTTQDTYFKSRYFGSCPEGGVSCADILRVAKAYRIKAVRIETEKNLKGKINKVLNYIGPVVCEIMMDPKQTLFPKLSSEVRADGQIISKPLEDMYPFLPRKNFRKNMIIPEWKGE
ncbi:MAG TPA: thiamine pyrophosphate-binding protein [bacterium]|nr:thiamine pyrophosphate-binding protein [bacterium]